MLVLLEEGLKEFLAGGSDKDIVFNSKPGQPFRDLLIRPEHLLGGIHVQEMSLKQLALTLGLNEDKNDDEPAELANKPSKTILRKYASKVAKKMEAEFRDGLPPIVELLTLNHGQIKNYLKDGCLLGRELGTQS